MYVWLGFCVKTVPVVKKVSFKPTTTMGKLLPPPLRLPGSGRGGENGRTRARKGRPRAPHFPLTQASKQPAVKHESTSAEEKGQLSKAGSVIGKSGWWRMITIFSVSADLLCSDLQLSCLFPITELLQRNL